MLTQSLLQSIQGLQYRNSASKCELSGSIMNLSRHLFPSARKIVSLLLRPKMTVRSHALHKQVPPADKDYVPSTGTQMAIQGHQKIAVE
jgi:hypothetical protein